MAKPLIAVCPQYDLNTGLYRMAPSYMEALEAAGALPTILSFGVSAADLPRLVSVFDGLLVPGGPDVSPFCFGEDALAACGPICRQRDQLETLMIPAFLEAGKPVFGICRGIQIMNILLGGDIYQDIPSMTDSRLQHKQTAPETEPVHQVTVTENSLLRQITGQATLLVNSLHHQAVRDPAPGFVPCAYSADGLIEAQYMPDRSFVLGVQWHPELLWKEDPSALALFEAFAKACQSSK